MAQGLKNDFNLFWSDLFYIPVWQKMIIHSYKYKKEILI